MMSDWRKQWLDFKKDHPKFEQSKSFKSDVGPQMDDFQDALEKYSDAAASLEKARNDMDKIRDNLEGAIAGYRRILSSGDMKDDKTAEKDFDGTLALGNVLLARRKNRLRACCTEIPDRYFNW
jgi:hypothetical protein